MDFAAARRNMVASQIRTNEVTDPLVVAALSEVPREKFVPPAQRGFAYIDEDLPVAKGRFIMEPVVLARLLQMADVQPTDIALIVGAGAGYATAVTARLASSVVALESDAELAAMATKALDELGVDNAAVVIGELKRGCPAQGPFDIILINGAVAEIPDALKQQLSDGGRLVGVVRSGPVGRATLVTRSGSAFGSRQDFDAMTPFLAGFEPAPGFVF